MPNATHPPRRMRFSFESRCRLVQLVLAGHSPQAAAAACGASRATGYRLWRRYCEGGWAALADRPSTPRRQPRRLPAEAEQEIVAWREHLRAGPLVLSAVLERPASTIGKVLRRLGCSRLPRPARASGVRYERATAGELLHVDTKKLGRFWTVGKRIVARADTPESRGAGWHWLHIAIDDHSRLAYAELLNPRTASPARPSSSARLPGIASRESSSSASSPTMPRPTTRTAGTASAPSSESSVAIRDRTHPGRTAKRRGADQDDAARVGVPLHLSHQRTPQPRPPRLRPLVQPTQTTRLPRRPASDQPCLTPLWSVQLAEVRPAHVSARLDRVAAFVPPCARDRPHPAAGQVAQENEAVVAVVVDVQRPAAELHGGVRALEDAQRLPPASSIAHGRAREPGWEGCASNQALGTRMVETVSSQGKPTHATPSPFRQHGSRTQRPALHRYPGAPMVIDGPRHSPLPSSRPGASTRACRRR